MLLLKTIVELISTEEPTWKPYEPTRDDIDHMNREVYSRFDVLGLKKNTMEDLGKGDAKLVCRECTYGIVMAIVYPNQVIPWDLFARIFATFGVSKYRVVFFANPTKRTMNTREPGKESMNGGYTIPCRPDTLVIYREEEAARVLIHELLHAACTDNNKDSIEMIEAKTETWAELILVAIQGKTLEKTKRLWKIQAQWIANQENMMRSLGVTSPANYAWRYTMGRRDVLENLGISLPPPNGFKSNSSRFTDPRLCP